MDTADHLLTDSERQCVEVCRKKWEEACIIYKLPEDFELKLFFSGNQGLAKRAGSQTIGHARVMAVGGKATRGEVRLNRLAIQQDLKDTLEDTIPHEIAHIVCGIRPELGEGHNAGWKRVCRRLGGSGEAKAKIETYDLRQRVRWRYRYVADSGREVWLTDVKHGRLLSGRVLAYTFTDTYERVETRHFTGEKR